MKKSFWLFIIIAVLLVVFSVQNAFEVSVNLFFYEVRLSMAVLLIITFLLGLLVGAIYGYAKRNKRTAKKKESEKHESENQVNEEQ
ncbi:LapA family protein [Marinilabiliaceae bacterium JC017]|nr:LapA family protein [Marinilabiliaceae bacterium JC017]